MCEICLKLIIEIKIVKNVSGKNCHASKNDHKDDYKDEAS